MPSAGARTAGGRSCLASVVFVLCEGSERGPGFGRGAAWRLAARGLLGRAQPADAGQLPAMSPLGRLALPLDGLVLLISEGEDKACG